MSQNMLGNTTLFSIPWRVLYNIGDIFTIYVKYESLMKPSGSGIFLVVRFKLTMQFI